MKNGINKKLLFLIAFLLIGMMFVVYVTYAYYIAEAIGNESESTVAVTGGSLTINYQNNSGDIVAEKIMPGWSATKSFTVTATKDYNEEYDTNFKIWYDMLLIIDRNDFLTGSLEYMLSPINSDVSKEGIFIDDTYKPIPTVTNTESISMGSGYLPNDTASHTYNLSLRYLDREEIDQTSEMEGKFYARVNVRGSDQAIATIDLNGGTLSNFSLDTSNKSKIAKDSEIYIPAPMKEGYTFNGWEITSGDGTVSGNKIIANSLAITVQAQYVKLPSFADDDWATIAANVQANKAATASTYKVGDTKEVTIDGTNYTVRIANNSNYDCSLESKTACGFVVEFVDIVEKRAMNSSATNVGGWPATEMRAYLNGEFLAKLPSDLQSVIADTTVVSGHGSTSGETNFTSTDKIYLLSTKEVWSDGISYDTATGSTRQLEYYANNNVATSNYSGAKKNYAGTAAWWWLRAAGSGDDIGFLLVASAGAWNGGNATNTSVGVAPAFRIE